VREVLVALQAAAYEGWYVLEQDTAIASAAAEPAGDVRRSIEFLASVLGSGLTVNTKEGVT
jgi:inosose dehydratase